MTGAAQLTLDLGHRVALGREDFLVAPSNRDAVAWVDRWPDWPGPCLVLHGPDGSGKTHLAEVWRARTDADVLALDAPDAGDDAIAAAHGKMCWVIEGAEWARDDRAMLHMFNSVAERSGHLLVTARQPPARWGDRLPDLMSRLRAAPTVALASPDDTLIAALLVKQFADRQIPVGDDVVTYLVTRIERSFGAVQSIVTAIDQAALAQKRRVTLPLVRDLLRARAICD